MDLAVEMRTIDGKIPHKIKNLDGVSDFYSKDTPQSLSYNIRGNFARSLPGKSIG